MFPECIENRFPVQDILLDLIVGSHELWYKGEDISEEGGGNHDHAFEWVAEDDVALWVRGELGACLSVGRWNEVGRGV
jgi:hypothetical protein